MASTQSDHNFMHVANRRIGNSRGVVIPKPAKPVRAGWADGARKIAASGDDALVMGEFGNEADAELA